MRWIVLCAALSSGCAIRHTAPVATPALPPLPATVQHSGSLWIELGGHTDDKQCTRPEGQRTLCFSHLHAALASAIAQTSWTSFPSVALKQKGDNLSPGDYVLLVDLDIGPLPPDARGPGWSATGRARWKLARDGVPIASGSVASRSRSDFAYGRALGVGAGEVVGAISAHISSRISGLPEDKPLPRVPLPPVAANENPEPALSLRSTRDVARSPRGAR